MNIRFSILSLCFIFVLVLPAVAQGSPKSAASPPAAARASVSSSSASVDPGLPNEKTLLIGGPQNAAKSSKSAKPLGVWSFVQMILVLGLVIAGIYLLFFFLKRMSGTKQPENQVISVLSTRVLQPNRSLHLVDVGGSLFLVGTSENSVNLVSTIQDKDAVDEIRLRVAQTGPHPDRRAFRDVFAGAFRKGGGIGLGGSIMDSMGFMRQQRERLKKM